MSADQDHRTTPHAALDSVDRKLLDLIQTDFPLAPRPYALLGERLGIAEEEALERVRSLRQRHVIRRLGANFQSSKLGFVSTLCAAKVPPDKLDMFVEKVNACPGVTHNYLREHAYNVWFTLISPSREDEHRTLEDIATHTGVPILNLPATRLFKIRVDFRMDADGLTS
ncbi:MAG: AsnC family transcriptional regulator [Desulfovibrio sp.]|nr:AsnC family transcriptional regulator [Desulfovibrio sp.]